MFHQQRLVLNCFNSWAATLCNFLGLDMTDEPHAVVSDRVQGVVIGKEQRGQTARRHTHRETEERTTTGQIRNQKMTKKKASRQGRAIP